MENKKNNYNFILYGSDIITDLNGLKSIYWEPFDRADSEELAWKKAITHVNNGTYRYVDVRYMPGTTIEDSNNWKSLGVYF